MLKTTVFAAIVSLAVVGLAGCDVKKTQEGKYEVTPPDVKVGSTEKTVTVPKVTTEEKKVQVPTVTITPPPDDKKQ